MKLLNISTLLSFGLFSSALLFGQQYYSNDGSWYTYQNNRQETQQPVGTDWEYQESWRNNKQAYFKGETQPQAWRDAHPYGRGGIGISPDQEYVGMEDSYNQTHPRQGHPNYQQPGCN